MMANNRAIAEKLPGEEGKGFDTYILVSTHHISSLNPSLRYAQERAGQFRRSFAHQKGFISTY